MATRTITLFQVGNGNFCLMEIDGLTLALDIHGTEDKSSLEMLKPFLLKKNGKHHLDVLGISHGDKDHCGGFAEFKKEMESGNLVVGSIWHPNYDRTKVEDRKDLPEDYLKLHAEIMRRRRVENPGYGDVEVPLTAWDDESKAFKVIGEPSNFSLRVLSPYFKDEDNTELDVNDLSLAINITVSGLSILFPGDSSAQIWQERIIPYTLSKEGMKDWAKAKILLASHHGSFSFFGRSREEVLNADPSPENYGALDYIEPEFLLVSAESRFPISGDSSGDQPPHYAAWKWYHKWFRENREVGVDDKHPSQFKYTADGNIRLEYDGGQWNWVDDWAPDDNGGNRSIGFVYHRRETERAGDHYA